MTTKTPNPSLTRRGLLRKGTAATVATLGVGASASRLDRSPVGDAKALAPLGVMAAVGLTYLAYKGATKILGDNRDYSTYTGADALHQEIHVGAAEMDSADERVMTSIQNNITNSQNVALAKGKAAIIKEMNAGSSESAAQTAMANAIDSYYSTIEENVLIHYQSQYSQAQHHADQVFTHSSIALENAFQYYNFGNTTFESYSGNHIAFLLGHRLDHSNSLGSQVVTTADYQLLDGSTVTVDIAHWDDSTGNTAAVAPHPSLISVPADLTRFLVQPVTTGDPTTQYFDASRFPSVLDAIVTERDDVNAQLSGFVTDVYSQYAPGDIPTEDIVDPITASTELSQNYDGYQTRAAHAAMMGIPTNAANSLVIEVEDTSDGSTALLEADLYTNHVPTDGSGNEVGFQVDQAYDPSTWAEPLYIAYRYTETDSSGQVISETQEFEQLEMPFTVLEATDKDGNSVTSFQTQSRNNQTADVTTIQEELDQIRQTQIEMQEEAQDDTQSGGGTSTDSGFNWDQFSIAGIPGVAVVAIGGLAAYAGFQSGNYGN
ncbi:hypothetical protein ACERIT_03800 [Halopenitus sp. H-Gu1]|uniref:hypothetical protein n=1 Tax=Halopenitus sp. H-Gu1 TaxID=3242697 RepID=UPI00359E2BB8